MILFGSLHTQLSDHKIGSYHNKSLCTEQSILLYQTFPGTPFSGNILLITYLGQVKFHFFADEDSLVLFVGGFLEGNAKNILYSRNLSARVPSIAHLYLKICIY